MALTFKKMKQEDKSYVKKLARNEIGINPTRFKQHQTYLIDYHDRRIGFISYRVNEGAVLYIYMLAFEKNAQHRGFAAQVLEWLLAKELQKHSLRGLSARIYKVNKQAMKAAQKYGLKKIEARSRYNVFMKKL
jgi:ribosomal protein S18 acetylase RimI-like enzyme